MLPDELSSIIVKFSSAGWAAQSTTLDRAPSAGPSHAQVRFTPLGVARLKAIADALSELESESALTPTEFIALLLYAKKIRTSLP